MTAEHPLLGRQLARASAEGRIDTARLAALVSDAYHEHDRELRRADRANAAMAEELEAANRGLRDSMREEVQNRRFAAALNHMPQGLALYDRSGLLLFCNEPFKAHYRLPADFNPIAKPLDEILGRSAALLGAGAVEQRRLINACLSLPVDASSAIEQVWPDGRTFTVSRNPIDSGGYIDTQTDITESRRAMAQIAHMANYDALTDLPNRRLFRDRLVETIQVAERGELSAVMCLDLDRFKTVNDTLGHGVGDALLVAVTARLKRKMRGVDTVARLGGDEFAIIVRRLKEKDQAVLLAERVIASLSEPFRIDGHRIAVGASIGIEFITRETTGPDDVIRNADLALYDAKTAGRGVASVFRQELHECLAHRRQLEIELREGLAGGEFELWYQPQFVTRTRGLCGFEALVRWRSPRRGLVAPSEFIPLCEEVGLINELGAFVLRRACRDAVKWPKGLSVAVNLSPVQFRWGHLVSTVREILAETGLESSRLDLEVTEGVMISDVANALDVLNGLRALGVTISLDDFGTGYSSLGYIRHFPFNKIKIDKSFIADLGRSNDSLAIIRAVTGLCSSLGITSIAEGVETQAQYDLLSAERCDQVQGYLTGRPVPFADTFAFFEGASSACA